jgi:hypothetical protein
LLSAIVKKLRTTLKVEAMPTRRARA